VRGERSGRDDRSARGGRSDRGEIFGRNERPVRDDRRTRDDRPARTERPARGERPFRDEGPARDGAPRRGPGARSGEFTPRGGAYAARGGPRSADTRYSDAERPRRKPPRAAPQAAAPTPKTPGMPVREGERIAKLLARAGVASRREVERLIIEGRVKLGDDVIETPSTVLTSLRGITVDGNPVRDAEETRLFAFHKPAGLLTAERDPAGRPTIYTALRNALPEGSGRVMPIGRLDLNTEGLLLLTNDGAFKRELELPATGVPRTYRARTFGDISQAQLEDLIEGIEIEGVVYGKIDANMERRTGRNQWIEMTLTEGKNREVRRVLEHLGLQVSRLIRTSYGPFQLLDLPKGMAIEISPRDLENFRRSLPGSKA
jgi:23S rRNA pseudouridine2605 synthase